jgi:fucose 4-O-acetylase-like acetyltransferase
VQKGDKKSVEKGKKQRIEIIDVSKSILILLVLLGHSVQFASGKEYLSSGAFYGNWVFKLIYGFHMPCFMAVSGYLFWFAVKSKAVKDIVVGKIRTLIVPIFVFAFIVWLCGFNPEYSFLDQIRNYLSCTRFTLWFLWALFYSSMGVLLVNKVIKDSIWVYLLLILVSFLTPDKWFSELYKFLFPCFLFGYFAHKNNWIEWLRKNIGVVTCVTLVLYVLAMFLYYDTNTYVYMSGSCILTERTINWHQLFIDLYRTLVGVCGTTAFVSVLMLVLERVSVQGKLVKGLAWLGTMTMGIYCFQDYFWRIYINQVTCVLRPIAVNRLLVFVVSLVLSCTLTWAVSRVKFLRMLFLGGR